MEKKDTTQSNQVQAFREVADNIVPNAESDEDPDPAATQAAAGEIAENGLSAALKAQRRRARHEQVLLDRFEVQTHKQSSI